LAQGIITDSLAQGTLTGIMAQVMFTDFWQMENLQTVWHR